MDERSIQRGHHAGARAAAPVSVVATSRFEDVEAAWRILEQQGIESPGQSYDFLACWMQRFAIPREQRLFVIAYAGEQPVVALALHRDRIWGMNVLADFPRNHVGTNAPLVDLAYLASLSVPQRRQLWSRIRGVLDGADLAYICCIPKSYPDMGDLFGGFGATVAGDTLHRAAFCSWENCDREQRNRSRRKHDKQQGAKLERMGEVTFETLETGDEIGDVLSKMFVQRNERFVQQGIADPFDDPDVRAFYADVFQGGPTLKGRMHVLRLDGRVVAVRYNLVHGERMFCLISSMDTSPAIQPGSPGKQCLLRVMRTEFDNGFRMFDMGDGMTDEKRHWCNVHIPLRHHYLPLSLRGYLFTQVHRAYQGTKVALKSNASVFATLKRLRSRLRGRKV